jgi:hypothetical protein
MSGEDLDFKIGEDEEPATVEMDDNGENAVVTEKEEAPLVETSPTKKDELDQYGDKVQKRIDKLTGRLRETQRREEAAIEYARNLQQRADELEQRFQRTDADRLIEAKGRIDTQMITLKQIIKKAREEYDIDTETEAQQRLTSMMMDQQRVSDATEYRQQALSRQQQAPQQQAYQPQAQQQQHVAPKAPVDLQAEAWAENNPWFGTNTVMTGAVRGIHLDLIQKEGFDPQSEEYYDEIDRRMRNIFPKETKPHTTNQDNRNARPVQTVAPATRSSGVNNSARRTVKLSASQVAIAKRLNVPLEEYAKYVKE